MPGFNPANYTEVKDRLPLFWEACPDGRIVTEIYAMTDDWSRVIIKASVYQHRDDPEPTTTGFAEETQTTGGGGANRYSHIENCETSAIGRALANYRFPGSGPRPSREEMTKVQRAEQSASRPAPRQEPRPLRPSAPAAEDATAPGADYGWSDFWPWAKARGINDRQALDAAAGQPTSGKTPAEIRRLIEARAATA